MELQEEVAQLEKQVLIIQRRIKYLKTQGRISHFLRTVKFIPNDYLVSTYGTEQKFNDLLLDWDSFHRTNSTEESILKTINTIVKRVKEHYSASDLSWVKPMKAAVKDYFTYTNREE